MDLVSSTLDKYLKHRFNGSSLLEMSSSLANSNNIVDIPQQHQHQTRINEPDPSMAVPPNNQTSNISNASSSSTAAPKPSQFINEISPSNSSIDLMNTKSYNDQSPPNTLPVSPSDELHRITKQEPKILTTHHIMVNGKNDCRLPTIHNISISNSQPCCVALRTDLCFLAAGFENSHIYLWNFKKEDAPILNIDSMFTLLGHSGSVYSVEFVNNNDLMLSCSEDTTIRLWCLNTKCNVIVYRGHNYPVWSLDIGSQGKFFVSASMDATARLWRLDKITPLRIFCGHDDDVECVKFHPNEKYLATGSSDATVRLWSVSDGKMVRLMVGHRDPIISLSFLPNGKFLASASRDGVIKVWNLATNSVSSELSVPASFTISFDSEQKFVSSCGVDNVLRLWQIGEADLVERKRLDLKAKSSNLIQSQFHRDNKLFIITYLYDDKTKNK